MNTKNILAWKIAKIEDKIFSTTGLINKSQYDANKQVLQIKIRCFDNKYLILMDSGGSAKSKTNRKRLQRKKNKQTNKKKK